MASTDRTGSSLGTSYTTRYYKMRAIDPDAPSLTYVTWVVPETPDTTGSKYTGSKSGNSSLTNIVILYHWVGSA